MYITDQFTLPDGFYFSLNNQVYLIAFPFSLFDFFQYVFQCRSVGDEIFQLCTKISSFHLHLFKDIFIVFWPLLSFIRKWLSFLSLLSYMKCYFFLWMFSRFSVYFWSSEFNYNFLKCVLYIYLACHLLSFLDLWVGIFFSQLSKKCLLIISSNIFILRSLKLFLLGLQFYIYARSFYILRYSVLVYVSFLFLLLFSPCFYLDNF